jgi:hypothetical protein
LSPDDWPYGADDACQVNATSTRLNRNRYARSRFWLLVKAESDPLEKQERSSRSAHYPLALRLHFIELDSMWPV